MNFHQWGRRKSRPANGKTQRKRKPSHHHTHITSHMHEFLHKKQAEELAMLMVACNEVFEQLALVDHKSQRRRARVKNCSQRPRVQAESSQAWRSWAVRGVLAPGYLLSSGTPAHLGNLPARHRQTGPSLRRKSATGRPGRKIDGARWKRVHSLWRTCI